MTAERQMSRRGPLISVGTATMRLRSMLGRGRSRLVAVLVVLGVAASLVWAVQARGAPGVYWSRVQVRFLSPGSDPNANDLVYPSSEMITLAGAVGKMVDPSDQPRVVSPTATLAGQGITHGWSVVLPNTGGQWASQFVSPYLDVQVVGTTISEVRSGMSGLLAKIDSDLRILEQRASVPSKYFIRTHQSPPGGLPIYYLDGSGIRAGIAALALGLGLTITLAWQANRLFGRLSSQRVPADPVSRTALA